LFLRSARDLEFSFLRSARDLEFSFCRRAGNQSVTVASACCSEPTGTRMVLNILSRADQKEENLSRPNIKHSTILDSTWNIIPERGLPVLRTQILLSHHGTTRRQTESQYSRLLDQVDTGVGTNRSKQPRPIKRTMAPTASQQVALAVTPKISAALSMLGSAWIAVEVLTQQSKRGNVYNRLLCAMSVGDLLASLFFFLSTWPIPSLVEGIAFNVGNQHTCTAQGFFIQLSIMNPLCECRMSPAWNITRRNRLMLSFCPSIHPSIHPSDNACLAFYYMLVIKHGVSEERLRSKFELPLHLLPISFGVLTATAGIFLKLYNNANLWCWIAPDPADCEVSVTHGGETTCERGDNAWVYR
jgi:hypothetical protein